MTENLPRLLQLRLPLSLSQAMDRRVSRRKARDPQYTVSRYVRELIAADLDTFAPPETPPAPQEGADSPEIGPNRRSGTVSRPPADKKAIVRDLMADLADTKPRRPSADEMLGPIDAEGHLIDPESVPEAISWFQAPHMALDDGSCAAGCDLASDELCRWPKDDPRRKRVGR